MKQFDNTQITSLIRQFFSVRQVPGRLRFEALLAGDISGTVWLDDLDTPTWGILQEAAYGTLHLQGSFPDDFLAGFIETRKAHGDVLYGFWEDETPGHNGLPPTMYDGHVLESYSRSAEINLTPWLQNVPNGCVCLPIDAALFPRLQDYQFYSDMFGGANRALEMMFGYVLMRADEIVCEAYAGTAADGVIELGVNTQEGHRQMGYATAACAHVIHEAEKRGYQTYWNCALQNKPSVGLAHKLGYAPMTRYRLWGWFK
jgi:RimJ/RimL family protein N-acetyltransferase